MQPETTPAQTSQKRRCGKQSANSTPRCPGEPYRILPAAVSVTHREQQILPLIAEGHTSKTIGEIMGLSARTVERHRANLLKKFRLNNSIALIQTAKRQGLL